MGFLLEDEQFINDEKSLINILVKNGFQKVEPNTELQTKIEDKFGKMKNGQNSFNLTDTNWFYYNPQKETYAVKFKNSKTPSVSKFGVYVPKKGEYDAKKGLHVNFPMRASFLDEYFERDIDQTWDAQSITYELDRVKQAYHNSLKAVPNGTIIKVSDNKKLDDNFTNLFKKNTKELIDNSEKHYNELSQEEKTKEVTSKQFNVKYNNIREYLDEVIKDASATNLYDIPLASNKIDNNTTRTNNSIDYDIKPVED